MSVGCLRPATVQSSQARTVRIPAPQALYCCRNRIQTLRVDCWIDVQMVAAVYPAHRSAPKQRRQKLSNCGSIL